MKKNYIYAILITCLFITNTLKAQTFNGTTGTIPDNSCTASNQFNATASSTGIIGTDVVFDNITLDILHTADEDLDITLIAPDGTEVILANDLGGLGNDYANTTFSPNATNSITSGSPPFTGLFLPQGDFNDFNGKDADGTWILQVCDDASFFVGNLNSWSITFVAVTSVPDTAFENYLETHDANGDTVLFSDPTNMGNGIEGDNLVLTSRINTVTELDVHGRSISSLTGIEDFVALTSLDCGVNTITSLNLNPSTPLQTLKYGGNSITDVVFSNYPNLETLHCQNNGLNTLDLSQNIALTKLTCSNNNLESLIVTANTALTSLKCGNNQLMDIDVTANTALTNLSCSNNNLETLTVAVNTALTNLSCSNNNLETLTVAVNTALTDLNCSNNQLTSLNMANGNNSFFFILVISGNSNLTCVTSDVGVVDDWNAGNNLPEFAFFKDAQTFFSEDCASLSVLDVDASNFSLYPNPAADNISIQSSISIEKVELYSILGKQLLSTQEVETIEVSHLQSGVYFLKIFSTNGSTVKRFIKE